MSLKKNLLQNGVPIFDWETPNAFEEQVFLDVPTDLATKIVRIAVAEHGIDSVESRLKSGNIPFEICDEEIQLSAMSPEDRKNLGTIAKKKKVEWYKRIDLGELLGNVTFENWNCIDEKTRLKVIVDALTKWVVDSDSGGN